MPFPAFPYRMLIEGNWAAQIATRRCGAIPADDSLLATIQQSAHRTSPVDTYQMRSHLSRIAVPFNLNWLGNGS